jgi:hypothetical protein
VRFVASLFLLILVAAPSADAQRASRDRPRGVHRGTLATLKARGVQVAYGPYPASADQRATVIVKDNSGNLIQLFGK